jgi:hypothetical protein
MHSTAWWGVRRSIKSSCMCSFVTGPLDLHGALGALNMDISTNIFKPASDVHLKFVKHMSSSYNPYQLLELEICNLQQSNLIKPGFRWICASIRLSK